MSEQLAELRKLAAEGDYFAVLGVPHAYEVDLAQLRQHYLERSRATHPDFYTGDAEGLSEVLTLSATVNDAYRTLEDPVRRAEYVLLRHGGKDAGQDKRVPQDMLGEVLMMREEIDEAKASNDVATLGMFRKQMERKRAEVLEVIGELAAKLTAGGADVPGDPRVLDDLRLELNAMKYVENILGQV